MGNTHPPDIDVSKSRFPFCIVWTPIPLLTWIIPIVGHMGIALSTGVIRDFAGPYYVSEDNMAFGRPTKYWCMDPLQAQGGTNTWDRAITEASDVYKGRVHNLFCDNCHSHVAMALNIMNYDNSKNWNMVKLAILMLFHSRYVNFMGFIKTWLPFLILLTTIVVLCFYV